MFFSKRVRTESPLHDQNQTLRHLKCIGLSVPFLFWNCTICLMLHWDSHQVFISVVSESLGYNIGVKSTFCPFIKKLFCFAHSAVFCSYSYFLVVSCYYWGFDCSHLLCCFLCNSFIRYHATFMSFPISFELSSGFLYLYTSISFSC